MRIRNIRQQKLLSRTDSEQINAAEKLKATKRSQLNTVSQDAAIFTKTSTEPTQLSSYSPLTKPEQIRQSENEESVATEKVDKPQLLDRLNNYREDNPVIGRILNHYVEWSESENLPPRSTDSFSAYLDKFPAVQKYTSQHQGFYDALFKLAESAQ